MKRVKDITIVLGPPAPEEKKRELAEWSRSSGKPKEEVWMEYVHRVLTELAQRKSPTLPSALDELFSDLLKTRVRIDDPFMTFMLLSGTTSPAMIIDCATLPPVSQGFSDPQIRQAAGAMLGILLKTEWVRTLVTYQM